jgi:sortase (surface protein transpeptidase)
MAEIIIYHHIYNKKFGTLSLSQKPNKVSTAFLLASRLFALAGITLIISFYSPNVLAFSRTVVSAVEANFNLNSSEVQNLKATANIVRSTFLPPFDPLLSKVNRVIIPSIGVDGDINEATLDNYEAALKEGVWRVSDFGAPDDNSMPIILAAHRFGYLAWTNLFRRENSFYNLPKVKVGDIIEINWQQRHYVYEVYATGTGAAITDYSADLVLYTCESLTGNQRFFVYAHLIHTL